jgi:riboflavin biosynthesis pyrimidine reductase
LSHSILFVFCSCSLPSPSRQEACLWNVSEAPTIICTEKGSNRELQAELRKRGVEVVEFDGLTPGTVADFCYARGFLQLLWECGGGLAAPAIADAVIHKVMVFIAPKIVRFLGSCCRPWIAEARERCFARVSVFASADLSVPWWPDRRDGGPDADRGPRA